jgi:two-component system, OmpR family, phosphate regulon sensor histidine kinase PhoR
VVEGQHHNVAREPSSWLGRLKRARFVLITASVLFFVLAAVGTLSWTQALIGFALIAGAALIEIMPGTQPSIGTTRETGAKLPLNPTIETTIAGVPDPVIVLDREGIVVAFNAAARTIAPTLTRNEPISFALRIPDVVDAVRRAASSRQDQRVEFVERVRPDRVAVDRWSEAFVNPIVFSEESSGKRTEFVLVTFHDLTQVRRTEAMRADFVANASHELRTPLASLSGFIETLQGSARDDPQARARFLGIMKDQATRMARLIDDLLSLSRVELKAHLQPTTPVDLVLIVRQVADSLQTLARDRGVKISIEKPANALIVRGDRDELIRVFENLIENALKYGSTGERVDITLASDAGMRGEPEAVVAVRDYGPGIAPDHIPRLTERFYRVDVSESRTQGGTGLGLALVKHILARHRGRLGIESTPGNGATFTARLPLSPDSITADRINQIKSYT